MTRKQQLNILAFTCCLFLMISCVATKQTSVFSNMKKEADTLVVISPYMEMVATDFREKTPDYALAIQNKEQVTSVTDQLLKSKYVLKHIDMPDLNRDKLLAFYSDADKTSGENLAPMQQPFFPELKGIDHNRLAMFITYHAEYNSVTPAVPLNSPNGALVVVPGARPYSDFRLIVFNMQTNEVVFYSRIDTRNLGPNLPIDVERMTRKILKDVYYK